MTGHCNYNLLTLELFSKKFMHKAAHYILPAENNEPGLIETVKYGSKIFTDPDIIKKAGEKMGKVKFKLLL